LHVPFNDIEAMQQATTPQTAAILIEPIQGEGGINVPNASYLPAVRKWCDENNILMVADEVQTGMCRTGPLFAYQGMGFEPDVMTLAKGIGSGVPIGAILTKEHCAVFAPGDHGSTVSGNPLATAVAYAITKHMLENDFPTRVEKSGAYLRSKLESMKGRVAGFDHVRGKGLLLAIGLNGDLAEKVVRDCLENGLIVNNVRPNAIRLVPALNVTEAECDEAAAILEAAIKRVS
jgi:acetylornithine/succinyldiaminopimelate/putrescine aminotransferase